LSLQWTWLSSPHKNYWHWNRWDFVADTSAGAAADDPSDTEDVLVFLPLAAGLQVVFSAIDSEYASNMSSSSKTDANN
jgi:hypothetical protein